MAVVLSLILAACAGKAAPVAGIDGSTTPRLQVAGIPIVVPEGCELVDSTPEGSTLRCPETGVTLDWVHATHSSIDALSRPGGALELLEETRLSVGCQLGSIAGEGVAQTVRFEGRAFPLFTCMVPYDGAHAVIWCLGYDPRVQTDPPVPQPCDQVVVWQPVLMGRPEQ